MCLSTIHRAPRASRMRIGAAAAKLCAATRESAYSLQTCGPIDLRICAALAAQHAVIQFRLIETEDEEGNLKRVIRYAFSVGSGCGTRAQAIACTYERGRKHARNHRAHMQTRTARAHPCARARTLSRTHAHENASTHARTVNARPPARTVAAAAYVASPSRWTNVPHAVQYGRQRTAHCMTWQAIPHRPGIDQWLVHQRSMHCTHSLQPSAVQCSAVPTAPAAFFVELFVALCYTART
jgi:hypothetical protein